MVGKERRFRSTKLKTGSYRSVSDGSFVDLTGVAR